MVAFVNGFLFIPRVIIQRGEEATVKMVCIWNFTFIYTVEYTISGDPHIKWIEIEGEYNAIIVIR